MPCRSNRRCVARLVLVEQTPPIQTAFQVRWPLTYELMNRPRQCIARTAKGVPEQLILSWETANLGYENIVVRQSIIPRCTVY